LNEILFVFLLNVIQNDFMKVFVNFGYSWVEDSIFDFFN